MNFKSLRFLVFLLLVGPACQESKDKPGAAPTETPANPPAPAFSSLPISTDKAVYGPGQQVTFTLDNAALPAEARVRYKHLDKVVAEAALTSATWSWTSPGTDFRGYIAEVFGTSKGVETIYATVGVDVSSDWKKFPRYGFLSKFPQLPDQEVEQVISTLNRHHINGIQFYDWHHKHHKPLPVSGATPANSWKDILNRDIYFSTVQKYIASAHRRNMKAMFYNLIYGAWDGAEDEGVSREWFVYKDNTHTNKDFHPLPSPPFLSNIYLLDPANAAWQQYLKNENRKVYQALAFDGFHMDQLGDRGATFTYAGTSLNLAQTYKPFINAIKAEAPQKYVVMNAVNQYGQQGIAESGADFLYTEVWDPFNTYNDLANLIKQNNTLSSNTKNTVLAAYVNYDLAHNRGTFNSPSVLMTNAVIFAFGGSHLELGEHMLAQEYFPNNNLEMKEDLKRSLVHYYDFLVAYQNLLRDGGSFNQVALTAADAKMTIAPWPASQGTVAALGKQVGTNQVIHLINFKNSKTQSWRDNTGIQVAPTQINDAKLSFTSNKPVKKIWVASPDVIGGASRSLPFIQNGNKVNFTLPTLKYWSMIVMEY